jgi:hypothetical protein
MCTSTAAHILQEIEGLRQNRILQIFWTDTQFHELAPNFTHLNKALEGSNYRVTLLVSSG